MKSSNIGGLHKDTTREIIKQVLMNGPMTTKELRGATGISSKRMKKELAKHYMLSIALSVEGTRGGNTRWSTVSIGHGIADILGGRTFSEDEADRLSRFLAGADSKIRRAVSRASKFVPTAPHIESANCNGHLQGSEGKFVSTVPHIESANNNANLDAVQASKTHSQGCVSGVTGIYKKDKLHNRLIETSKKVVKNNRRHRETSSICGIEMPAKQGVAAVYAERGTVEGNLHKNLVDALQERLRTEWGTVGTNFETLCSLAESLLERFMVASEDLLFLALARKPSPVCEAVKETLNTEPQQDVEAPAPEKPTRKRKSSKRADEATASPETEESEELKKKRRKSRKGESGSFPNSAIPMFEELSLEFRHPIYEGKDHQTLDMQFARDYADAIHNADTNLPFYNAFLKMSTTFEHLKASGYQMHIHKARLRADSVGARYEDYLAAIFEAYRDRYDKFDGSNKRPPKYPQPAQLYGPKAQEYYDAWMMAQVDVPYKRYDHLPEYWPENYTGKDYQINYYTKMLEAVRRLCNYRHMIPWMVIDDLIFCRLMSQKFAEDPNLNRLMPGYKYSLAPYM